MDRLLLNVTRRQSQ